MPYISTNISDIYNIKDKGHMLLSHLATLFIALFACINACAQSVKANIENVGGYYRLTFTVTSSDVKGFTPPSLSALRC